jgi:hypothetical protein
VRGFFLPVSDGTNPSPVVLQLVKAPEADTLSPRERAESRAWGVSTIRRNEAGMSMKTIANHRSAVSFGERVARDGVLTGRRGSGEGFLPTHLGRN